jgi:hypothetical protein
MENSEGDLLLHPLDNVRVARVAREGVPLGFKVACRVIADGEKIVKWGAPIGSATRDIAPGEAVHLHNMKSDYLPTYSAEHRVDHA